MAFTALMLAFSSRAAATEYHVAPNGNDELNDGSEAAPFRSIDRAGWNLQPGDSVLVHDGTYEEVIFLTQSGTEDAWITFRSVNRHGAKIVGLEDANGAAFNLGGQNYIHIDGFDVTSGPDAYCIASVGGHHTIVENTYVHDCGGSGIQLNHGDYRYIYNNVAARNAFTVLNQGSGISLYEAVAFDDEPGFHNIVRNNVSYLNDNLTGNRSDGEGITVDDFRHEQSGGEPYTQETLVENNLVWGNGGAGIHIFISDHVTVRNNTAYFNQQRTDDLTWRGELFNGVGAYNTFVNNIAWADPSVGPYNVAILDAGDTNVDNVWVNNLTYNGIDGEASIRTPDGSPTVITEDDGNLLGVHPQLVDPNIEGTGDFRLRELSPAIAMSTAEYGAPPDDLEGKLRPADRFDLGAYQYSAVPEPVDNPNPTAEEPNTMDGTDLNGGVGPNNGNDITSGNDPSLEPALGMDPDLSGMDPLTSSADSTGGCACSVPASGAPWSSGLLSLVALGLLGARRRRHD